MKTAIRTMKRLVAPFVLLALLYGVSPASADAHDESRLSGKQLKALLATARTAEDHQKIAAYYRDRAQQLSVKAQEFSQRADYLATQPATIESKQGIGCNCTSHYRYFSKIYSQQAREFERKAAQEEEVVRKLGGVSSPSR
jgi:siderophore synthetase component